MKLADVKTGVTSRSLREHAGLSRDKLAALAECSTSTIVRLEREGRLPKTATTVKIADALNVSLDTLVHASEVTPAPALAEGGEQS